MVAAPAAVADDVRRDGIEEGKIGVESHGFVHLRVALVPKAVASPGIERPVVVGLENGVEHIAALDEMSAPGSLADVDA